MILCKPHIRGNCWLVDDIVREAAMRGMRVSRVSMPFGVIEGKIDPSLVDSLNDINGIIEVLVS